MTGLSELTNAPTVLAIAGRDFEARAVTLAEWGAIQSWYQDRVEHPLARLGKAIDQADAWGRPLADETVRAFYQAASSEPFPPRIGTPAWIAGLDSVEGGIARFLYHALAPSNPDLSLEEIEEAGGLAERATVEELQILQCVAFTGRPPLPKSGGSTTTTDPSPVEPDDSPSPTTPGTASSTPSARDAG